MLRLLLLSGLMALLVACGGGPLLSSLPPDEQAAVRRQRVAIDNIIYQLTKSNYGSGGGISRSSVPKAEEGVRLAEELRTSHGHYVIDTGETLDEVLSRKIRNLQARIDQAE